MKRISLISIAIICITSSIFLFGSQEISAQGNGQYHPFELDVDGITRQYTLYVPEGHDGTEEWPLVFFHGLTVKIDDQIKISQMYLVADTAKFLIVYPLGMQVYNRAIDYTGSGWNIPDIYVADQDDVSFTNKIINDINANPDIAIDLNRIHATGFSNGGQFSYYLACVLSHRIASVAGVAGQMTDTLINHMCAPSRQISILHMQGTNDILMPEFGDEFLLTLKGVPEFWAGINGCNAIPDSSSIEDVNKDDNSTVTLFNYDNCENGHEVLLYRIEGGGHAWPGTWLPAGNGTGPINKDISCQC